MYQEKFGRVLESGHACEFETSSMMAINDKLVNLEKVNPDDITEESFKNLNLQIVENGYSKSTIQNSPQYEYYPYFKKAETFAKENQLHIWSNDEDPNYSDAALNVTLKDLGYPKSF